jgi:two-component system, NtrC family, nitrogen regulation sensor histidine kinase NtrY
MTPGRLRWLAPRRPLRDNPVLILLWIGLLVAALAAMLSLAARSSQLSLDFLSSVVLYAVSVADLTLMLALVFVLARNILKLVVERRRALPFARFRAKLVAALLGLTLIPAVLVLLVGSEIIRNAASRWFSPPIDTVISSAREIASDYYAERTRAVTTHANALARDLSTVDLASSDLTTIRSILGTELGQRQLSLVEVYRVTGRETPPVAAVVEAAAPSLPPGFAPAFVLASRTASGGQNWSLERLPSGGELLRGSAPIRPSPDAAPTGVVIASVYLTDELARHSARIVEAYEDYTQLLALRQPIEGVYLSFFLGLTLLILISATWMGLFLAKRITRPVQRLAAGAREIGAGHLDHRIEPDTHDEFGALVEAFNTMAGELASSQERLDRSRLDLERKSLEADARRRYLETILERIATGVVCFDAQGHVSVVNPVARRLLALDADVLGAPAATVFGRDDLRPLAELASARPVARPDRGALRGRVAGGRDGNGGVAVAVPPDTAAQHEITLIRDGHERHLLAATTTLGGDGGALESVLVVDDVTPLVRAQKVAAWRDVARRLAHEIKNPLTPIQLSAERLKRHFVDAPEPTRRLVDECARAIIAEVESLKSLVDEFSQFARMPAPKAVPTDLNALLADALALYAGLLTHATIELTAAPDLPPVRLDPEQVRRVVINLVDNAIEALSEARETGRMSKDAAGVIAIDTAHLPAHGVVRLRVADNGPGLPAGDRSKLFMPYYSTKGRGSGLGLAIVRRIIAEHGGSIEAADNTPHGTCFTIELPV